MKRKTLDWTNFNWQGFQQLCIQIAQQIEPDCQFSEHLDIGHKQDGIDLLGFLRATGSFFCIQCKKDDGLNTTDVHKILQEFKEGNYFDKSSHFILAASTLINKTKFQNEINELKYSFFKQYHIEFDFWDRKKIEEKLQTRWDLVTAHFGIQQANDFCYPYLRTDLLENIKEPANFTSRGIQQYEKADIEKHFQWYFTNRNTYNLTELLTDSQNAAHRICLLGDAHYGKSFLLRQTAFEIKQSDKGLMPVFIEIKNYNVQPVTTLLKKLFNDWQNIPLKQIILFIDGVDEVQADRFDEMITHIKEFSLSYQPVSIVFSCRKLFFNEFSVDKKMDNFQVFDLCPLDIIGIDRYLQNRLGSLFESFEKRVSEAGIKDLLYHPFYLTQLTEEFLLPPHELPSSKIRITEGLIDRSFKQAEDRKLKGSDTVRHAKVLYRKTIEKFAFALQLGSVNSFSEDVMQELFTTEEILLLRNSPLITSSGTVWSFTNAFFQEHIAARVLSIMEYEQIVALSTVGRSIKKVRPKWIQTLSSLLAILNTEDALFQKIGELFEQDNLELLFQTESSKFDNESKFILLKKLIDKCVLLNTRPFVVYEDTIGVFIADSLRCKDFLLGCLINPEINERIRIVCCRILRTSRMNEHQRKIYLDFVLNELPNIDKSNYAAELLEVIITHRIGDINMVKTLISIQHLNSFSEYRDKVYEIMQNLSLVDAFYEYGLNGIAILKDQRKQVHVAGSERNLEEFLLAATKIQNFYKLISLLQKQELEHYFQDHVSYRKDFLTSLFEKLADYYSEYPLLVFPIARYVRYLGIKYFRDEFKQVDIFLEKTNTNWLVLRILIDDVFNDGSWQIGALITEDSYDYVLFEHEQNEYDIVRLRYCLRGLRYKNKGEEDNIFRQLCLDASEGKIFNDEDESKYLAYLEAEKKKKENDLIYIQNAKMFKDGVRKYFKAYGKSSIPIEDVYIDIEGKFGEIRKNSDCHFIYEFLVNWQGDRKVLHLQECLNALDDATYFEIFQAQEILDYSYRSAEPDIVLLPILKLYYEKMLPRADFVNCLWIEEESFKWKTMEYRLGQIFQKYQFDTPAKYLLEFLWLDNNGTRGFETGKLNKQETISQLILENLDTEGRLLLRKKIISNLRQGILFETVTGTHLQLCKELKLKEGVDVILEIIKTSNDVYYTKSDGVNIYLELGGDIKALIGLYQQYNKYDYFFLHLLTKLCPLYYVEIKEKALQAINHTDTEERYRTPISQILAEAGSDEAFFYLVNEFAIKKIPPKSYSRNYGVADIKTELILSEIGKLAFVLVDPDYDYKKYTDESLRTIILDWLYSVAKRSEGDLIKVIDFIETIKTELKKKYDDISDLNWYENRVLEEFRKSSDGLMHINEIKRIVKATGY